MGVVTYSPVAYWPLNTALYVVDFQGNNERFAYYLLKSLDFTRFNSGSAQPSLNRNYIHPIPIRVPPLSIQLRIADILGALDDKIECNRPINQTLEEMARALYKHWFVDFGPLRRGEFVPSESGQIPKGWKVSSLGELFPDQDCVITGPFGSNLHASDYRDQGVPLILVKHVLQGRIVEAAMPLVGDHKLAELDRYRVQLGDIVFTRVGVVGQSAYIYPRNVGWLISGQLLRVRVPSHLLCTWLKTLR
jgi:type I restriction enzyme S subunit